MLKPGDTVKVKSNDDVWEGIISTIEWNHVDIGLSQVWSNNWLCNGKNDGRGWMYYNDCVKIIKTPAMQLFYDLD